MSFPLRSRPRGRTKTRARRRKRSPDAVRPEQTAAAYRWPCGRLDAAPGVPCDCPRTLRGLLREGCAGCGHPHTPPHDKETPHAP